MLSIDASGDPKNTGLLKSDDRLALSVAGKPGNAGDCVAWFCKSDSIEAKKVYINAPKIKRAQDIGGNMLFFEMVFNKAK